MNKGKLDKGFGGRPKKSVTEKMERVTVFIPALLVPMYPPLRIRELVVSDSLGSAPTGGASKVIPAVDVSTPVVKVAPSDRMALAQAALSGAEAKTGLKQKEDINLVMVEQVYGETEFDKRALRLIKREMELPLVQKNALDDIRELFLGGKIADMSGILKTIQTWKNQADNY